MSRAAVYSAINESDALKTIGFSKTYSTRGMENAQEDRFIVLRWGTDEVAFGDHGPTMLTVWAYDRDTSYVAICAALKEVKKILLPMIHVLGSDGDYVSQVSYNGSSSDLYDDILKRSTKNSVFTVNSHNS